MKLHPFVVFAERLRGFDTLESAVAFARCNVPAVVCERRLGENGQLVLVESLRHDRLFDESTGEWRVMLA